MKITKRKLIEIIEEEVRKKQSELKKVRDSAVKKKKDREMDDLRWGGTELRQLARGIAEEGNPYHSEDGTFTNKKDAKSYSLYFQKGIRKAIGRTLKHKDDSGRGRSESGQGKYRIKDGSKKWESREVEERRICLTRRELAELVDDCIEEFISEFDRTHSEELDVITDGKGIDWSQECPRRGYRTYQELLVALNNLVAASKGDLNKAK